ncbi:F-box/LRR-repeat protein [Tripterygium wilfordii]|uniref:F-box/LRR-repeat protein n=1 Tax=Tripterygium wilfordii TaxID=458696 RepID=A0A7J7DQ78_TRIWF|nr:F-box/LRR-repeat protein At4g29420 [Tripterygium wilfordii]KAF5748510.1 F-box/LRR-repeat protein [Tripterygium wilfordii]
MSMDDLPDSLVLDILSRLSDSSDIARCRVVSKTLNLLSCQVRSINFFCSLSRYLKSRSPETRSLITPFKIVFADLVRSYRCLQSVSIGVEKSLAGISYDDLEDDSDDLFLTEVRFVKEWLPMVCGELRSLSISDFWAQSCWRRSDILSLISSSCHDLLQLELKNAWLSVDSLYPMPKLTSLTLEFIRLDDEDLSKVNGCFPSLQVLNLIGVGGLKEPKIHLLHLKTCKWTVSNAPHSLGIFAPILVKLELKCIKPSSIVLDTPLLADLNISIEKAKRFEGKEFLNLKNLHLESSRLLRLIDWFLPSRSKTVKKLTIESRKSPDLPQLKMIETTFYAFPNASTLNFGPLVWSRLVTCYGPEGLSSSATVMDQLKEITAYLMPCALNDSFGFISGLLRISVPNLSDMSLLIHHEVDSSIVTNLISKCIACHPRVRWRWGIWKEGAENSWHLVS